MKPLGQYLHCVKSQPIECFVTRTEHGWITVLRRSEGVEVKQLFDSAAEAEQKAAELRAAGERSLAAQSG
jgi:hypothetical protein